MKFSAAFFLATFAGAPLVATDLGLAHVALRVRDITATRDFYIKLGFEPAFEFNDARGVSTSYIKVNNRQFIELYRRATDAEPLGLMHVCFDTPALETLFAHYVAQGLKPTEPRKARAGNLLFNLRDPAGQTLEYTQYLPGSLHSNDRGQHLGAARVSARLTRSSVAMPDLSTGRVFFH